jgi:hypothetical protein
MALRLLRLSLVLLLSLSSTTTEASVDTPREMTDALALAALDLTAVRSSYLLSAVNSTIRTVLASKDHGFGSGFSCMVTTAGARLFCWAGAQAVVSNGGADASFFLDPYCSSAPAPTCRFVSAQVTDRHILALQNNGGLLVSFWAPHSFVQPRLGYHPGPFLQVAQFGGADDICALRTDGELTCWAWTGGGPTGATSRLSNGYFDATAIVSPSRLCGTSCTSSAGPLRSLTVSASSACGMSVGVCAVRIADNVGLCAGFRSQMNTTLLPDMRPPFEDSRYDAMWVAEVQMGADASNGGGDKRSDFIVALPVNITNAAVVGSSTIIDSRKFVDPNVHIPQLITYTIDGRPAKLRQWLREGTPCVSWSTAHRVLTSDEGAVDTLGEKIAYALPGCLDSTPPSVRPPTTTTFHFHPRPVPASSPQPKTSTVRVHGASIAPAAWPNYICRGSSSACGPRATSS